MNFVFVKTNVICRVCIRYQLKVLRVCANFVGENVLYNRDTNIWRPEWCRVICGETFGRSSKRETVTLKFYGRNETDLQSKFAQFNSVCIFIPIIRAPLARCYLGWKTAPKGFKAINSLWTLNAFKCKFSLISPFILLK